MDSWPANSGLVGTATDSIGSIQLNCSRAPESHVFTPSNE